MLRKSITYTNPFTEQEVTEEHYFHISKADMVEMEMEAANTKYTKKDAAPDEDAELTGFRAKIQRMVDAEDTKQLLDLIKDFVHRSYGKKVGDRFLKTQEIWEEFSSTEAYSQLLFDLCTDAEVAGQFINGVFPSNLAEEAQKIAAKAAKAGISVPTPEAPTALEAVEEVADATGADFPRDDGVQDMPKGISPERQAEIDTATPENPVTLTEAEFLALGMLKIQQGFAAGKYLVA